jgi:hypothetical protein
MHPPHSVLSKAEILSLQAAFGSDDVARKSWEIFCKDWSFDDLFPDLIPFVFANVKIDDANKFAGLMRGYSRYQWCKNQIVLQDVITILDRLDQRSIPVMLGGMFSVVHHAYSDCAMRNIHSVDLITSLGDSQQAEDIVNSSNECFKSHAKFKVTSTLVEGIGPRRSQGAWRDAIECQVLDRKALSVGMEDTLICVFSSRPRFSSVTPWIADMTTAIALPYAPTILNEKLNQYRVVNSIQTNLQYLSGLLLEANLSEKYSAFVPLSNLKISLLESILKQTPYSGNLLAMGSTLIEQLKLSKTEKTAD